MWHQCFRIPVVVPASQAMISHRRMSLGVVVALIMVLTGCTSIPQPRNAMADKNAVAILQKSMEAQGFASLQKLHAVTVRFEGKWSPLVGRIQPVLVDPAFRGSSQERYLIHEPAESQTHTGPRGSKQVDRSKGTTHVKYNGQESTDAQVIDAAALVADAYRMFLLGPSFFQERSATMQYLGTEYVDHRECDNLLAILRPGIGNSSEDRIILSIDRERRYLRRVRMTLDGLQSTRGAIADIYLRDHVRIDGVVWPTGFYEELKRPLDLSVHHWRLTAIAFDQAPDAGPAEKK